MKLGNDEHSRLIGKLIDIGIALSSVRDLDKLLELIVTEARALTRADGGSLFIKRAEGIRFMVSQNDTLSRNVGETSSEAAFKPFTIPLTSKSIVGHAITHGTLVNIPDAYDIAPAAEYAFNPDFDRRNNYRTHSMLTVPMQDTDGNIIGALQLINAQDAEGKVVPFSTTYEPLMNALASQAAVAIRNAEAGERLKQAHLDTIFRLSVAAEYRDKDTANHLRRMSNYSKIVAYNLGFSSDYCELMLTAAPMHDVGKLGVPDAVLLKPGRLTPEERTIMEQHTTMGAQILAGSDSDVLKFSEVIALCHHEKWDGNGYPNKIKGNAIPIAGRIVAVADVFDALTSRRVYKAAVPFEEVVTMIQKDSGTHFDPACVAAFVRGLEGIRAVYDDPKLKDEPPAEVAPHVPPPAADPTAPPQSPAASAATAPAGG